MLVMLQSLDSTVGCGTGFVLEDCCGKKCARSVASVLFQMEKIIVKALAMLILGTLNGNC